MEMKVLINQTPKQKSNYMPNIKHRFVSQTEKCEKTTLTIQEMEAIKESGSLEINRPIVKSHVKKLSKDLKNGRWVAASGNVIKFDRNGRLIDGRHRFLSHLMVGVPFTTYAIVGLDPQAILVTDVGKGRKTPDNTVLKIHIEHGTVPSKIEFDAARKRASVAKEVFRHTKGGYPTPQEIRDTETLYATAIAIATVPVDNEDAARPGYMAAIAEYATKDPSKAIAFRDAVGGDGLDFGIDTPIRKLQKYLSQASIGGSQMQEDYFRTVCAIHAYHLDLPFKNLVAKKNWDF